MSELESLEKQWKKFKQDFEKFLLSPDKWENQSRKYLEDKLKPKLQKILDIILNEDVANRDNKTIGDCLEFILKEGLLQELVAYGKSNKPEGLFVVCLKFISYIILDIQSTHIINHKEVHPAIMQLMIHIHNSIKNDMFEFHLQENEGLKKYIIEFIHSLTLKIYEQPNIVSLLFTDSRAGQRKGSYLPMSVLLVMLLKEKLSETEELKLSLRSCILLQLKLNNQEILRYIVEESEISVYLINKLSFFFQALPQEVELLPNNHVLQQYPDDEDTKYQPILNLHEQINQIYSHDKKDGHNEFKEFVKFIAFINKCAICIQHSGKLIDNLCSEFFNSFLLDNFQPRLVKLDKPRLARSTYQYLIQILS